MTQVSGTQTLAAFLLERIAEDEAGARAFIDGLDDFNRRALDVSPRVLAEVEAKRRIVAEHALAPTASPDDDPLCGVCGWAGGDFISPGCRTLRLLALPYASHPDFREEWKV